MNTEDLAGHDCGNREAIEGIDKRLPDFDIAPPLALVVEAVHSSDVCALVVAAQEEEVFGEFELVAEEQEDRLERLFAAIDVVAQEEEV